MNRRRSNLLRVVDCLKSGSKHYRTVSDETGIEVHLVSAVLSGNNDIFANDKSREIWSLAEGYQEYLVVSKRKEKSDSEKISRKLLRSILSRSDSDASYSNLSAEGESLFGDPRRVKASEKRSAGSRLIAARNGKFCWFTKETELSGASAAHLVAVKTCTRFVDNTQFNLIYLRNDIHTMYDCNFVEIHVCDPFRLRLDFKVGVLSGYAGPLYQTLDPEYAFQIQQRVVIENIRKNVPQDPQQVERLFGAICTKIREANECRDFDQCSHSTDRNGEQQLSIPSQVTL